MSLEDANSAKTTPASKYRDGVLVGKIEITAHTKHGPTLMVAVMPPHELEAGETLVTSSWILGSRNFVVLGEHDRPMKIPGKWYQVKITQKETK